MSYLDRKFELAKRTKISDQQTIILNIDKAKIKRLYEQYQSALLVAKELGCSTGAVYKYLKKYNIPLTSLYKGDRVSKSKTLNLNKDLLEKLYLKHGSIRKVSVELTRSPTTIRKYLQQYKII
ncbi:hypothetical protein LCGC14_0523170 [marine sediment metagenome]|uniref:TyrR-like helix-turn-helix domain-containing protein n=1 Tax=marine sediment metagenome TaxID=412755 RepID=A0A0F9UJE3_9ZZZZ